MQQKHTLHLNLRQVCLFPEYASHKRVLSAYSTLHDRHGPLVHRSGFFVFSLGRDVNKYSLAAFIAVEESFFAHVTHRVQYSVLS